jgi:hypothetical protein
MAANVNKKTRETIKVNKVSTVFTVCIFSGVPKYGNNGNDMLRLG